MIKVENISKSFGEDYIFENVSFQIKDTDKIGIVGDNGAGKTTLLKCLYDEDYLDSGDISITGTIGYIEQISFDSEDNLLYDEYLSLFPELKKLEEYKKKNHQQLDEEELNDYIKLANKVEELGGYRYQTNILKFMTNFGFTAKDLQRKVKTFSGGQKTKLALIKLLLINPDHLLLDEPTNHLDILTITWLENYLKGLKKCLIIISHDQKFLDNICNKTLEVENREINLYQTTFSNYQKQKKLNYEFKLKEYEKQQKLIQKYEEFIVKNNGTPSKIGQVNDRKKKLEQIKLLNKPHYNDTKIKFNFEGYHLKKNTYLEFYQVAVGYDKPLIQNFNFTLYGKDKVALIGKNGIGKTTIFNAILKQNHLKGKIKIPANIKVGYFDQEQKTLNPNQTLYDTIEQKGQFESMTAIRKYLGQFLFTKNDVFKKIKNLSGGQKVKLALAIMALEKYDLILLDEPTNHLDFTTKKILEKALKDFPGSIITITHDRHLINEFATHVIELNPTDSKIIEGNWDDYLATKKNQELNLKEEELDEQKKAKTVKKEKKTNKILSSKKNLNLQKIKILEEELFSLEMEKEEIENSLYLPETQKNYTLVSEYQTELMKIEKKLNEVYEQYHKYL